MRIRLMPDVEDELVVWAADERMNGKDDLDGTQRRGDMAARLGGYLDDLLADFKRKDLKLVIAQDLQVLRRRHAIEDSVGHNGSLRDSLTGNCCGFAQSGSARIARRFGRSACGISIVVRVFQGRLVFRVCIGVDVGLKQIAGAKTEGNRLFVQGEGVVKRESIVAHFVDDLAQARLHAGE